MDTPRVRALAYVVLAGTFRAGAVALAMAWVTSQDAATGATGGALHGTLTAFLTTWGVLALLPALALSAAELPLIRSLPAETQTALELRAIGTALAMGLAAGALGVARVPWLAPLGPWACCALAAGAIGGWLCPPVGRRGRPALGVAWLVFVAVLAGLAYAADPWAPLPRQTALGPEPAPTAVAETDQDRARALARTWIARHPPDTATDGPRPDIGTALVIEGLVWAGKTYEDELAVRHARSWLEREVDAAVLRGMDGPGAAALAALLELLALAKEPLDARARDGLLAMRTRAPRTRLGPPSAWGGLLPRGNTLESLSAYGLVLARAARMDRDRELHREARALWVATQTALGHDPTHLLRHAWIELGVTDARLPVEPVFWARGQALALRFLAAHVRYDRELLQDHDPELARELVRFALALIDRQDPCGLWNADLAPNSRAPLDISASALLGATLAQARATGALMSAQVRGLDNAIARAAVGLRRAILWDDGIPRVAGATRDPMIGYGPMYRAAIVTDDEPHAIGAMLLWLGRDRGHPTR